MTDKLALEKAIDFIESLTRDPLLLPDDIEMTLDDVQAHARIELASIRKVLGAAPQEHGDVRSVYPTLVSALHKIAALRDSEGDEPLDEAIDIAERAIAADRANFAIAVEAALEAAKMPAPQDHVQPVEPVSSAAFALHMEDYRAFVAKVAPRLHWKVWPEIENTGLYEGGLDGWRHGFGLIQLEASLLPDLIEKMKAALTNALATTEGQP